MSSSDFRELYFGEGFVELLANNQKQITIRKGLRDFEPGEVVEAVCAEGDRFLLLITSCEVTFAFDVSEKDLRDDGFYDLDDFFAGMRRYYPDLDEYDEVTAIRFKVIARKGAKIFIICPVRDADSDVTKEISNYIARLEEAGCQVHWPPRNTDQNDIHGLRICKDNCDAIITADEVHIWFDPSSEGSLFDRGMLFALLRLGFKKKVVWINETPPPFDQRKFEDFFATLVGGEDTVRLWFDLADLEFLFKGGMFFAFRRLGFKRKLFLLNPIQLTLWKSFQKVFVALADGSDIAREDAKCLRPSLAEGMEEWEMKYLG